jgi:23S rRNA G2445 N2-methylase RlmL
VDALKPLSGSTTCILDWFHIAKKIENIALPDEDKEKLTLIKWHLWRGNVERAQIRLAQLIEKVERSYKDRLQKFLNYISNNQTKVVDYRSRKKEGLVFTSQLAESTVESLINQRCKRQQQMRWSREGLNPILQLRAAIGSNDWCSTWKTAVMTALTQSKTSEPTLSH